jgi:type II secretion system (T2SS) protein M
MKSALLRLRDQLGTLGLAALALLTAIAAFYFMVLQPLEAKKARLEERVARQRSSAESGPTNAADKVGAVYQYLQKEEETTDWLAKLHGIGAATGVQLKSANYRTQKTEGRIVRYEMVVPIAGSYPQIRDFLKRSLAEIPVMSVDQLTLKRETRNDGAIQAELRLTLHMVKS